VHFYIQTKIKQLQELWESWSLGNLGSCVLTNIKILKPKTSHKIDTKSMLCMRARDSGQLEGLAKGENEKLFEIVVMMLNIENKDSN
jgi:hypothetical protein